jgi:small subunit ribosomal protein S6
MSTERTNIYEGMFLVPPAVAANLQAAVDHIHDLLRRADAELVAFRKWDERRLAYEIRGNKRGVYFLAYFKAPTDKMARLERDCNLSEQILRAMFLRADHLPADQIEAADGRSELADEMKLREGGEDAAPVATGATEDEGS